MSFTKSDISRNIAKKTSIPNKTAKQLLDTFVQVVVSASAKKKVKISSFGTFERKISPSRIGRNPMTSEEFKISERYRLKLIVSNKIKEKLN
jgi:nucleoid DNA-binding protein